MQTSTILGVSNVQSVYIKHQKELFFTPSETKKGSRVVSYLAING